MKIICCVEFYYPSVGGAQEVVRQLAERLVARGHEVTVATTHIDTRKEKFYHGVRIEGFDVTGNMVRGLRGDVERYQRFLIEEQADIVFFYAAQQWTFDAAWGVLPRICGKKVLVPCGYSGLYQPTYFDYFAALPKILCQMDAVVYHAQDYRDTEFGRRNGLHNDVLIPNGAATEEFSVARDTKFRSSIGASERDAVVLTVGTVTGLKGHLELLKAFAHAKFADRAAVLILNGNIPQVGTPQPPLCRFASLVRGYGSIYALRHVMKMILLRVGFKVNNRNSIDSWANRINQGKYGNKRVVMVDLPRDRLIQAYLQSDLFVFASNVEYSPLVLFEACAAGLPFITVPVGNSREIVEWTGGGEVCEAPVDSQGYTRVEPAALATAMQSLLADPVRMTALALKGREASQRRYNWANLAMEYERLFSSLVSQEERANIGSLKEA